MQSNEVTSLRISHKSHITPTQLPHGCHPCGLILCDNISMEDVGIKGWYTSPPSSRTPLFLYKGRVIYDPARKAAGIRPDCAAESVMWYQAQGDDYGLQKYLDEVEARKEALDNGRIS